MFKFIGALIGYFILGRNLVGAFLGFVIGAMLDNMRSGKSGSGGNVFDYYRQQASRSHEDFATMLISLSEMPAALS